MTFGRAINYYRLIFDIIGQKMYARTAADLTRTPDRE